MLIAARRWASAGSVGPYCNTNNAVGNILLGSFAAFSPCASPAGRQEHVWGLFFFARVYESYSFSVDDVRSWRLNECLKQTLAVKTLWGGSEEVKFIPQESITMKFAKQR